MSDDVLRLFAFRTGVPCGYLLFFLFGVWCCVVAVVVLVAGVIRRSALLVALPVAFLLFVGVFVAGNVAYERALDLNPSVSEDELPGTWRTEQSVLTLKPDGAYEFHAGDDFAKDLDSRSSTGKWDHGSFNLLLTDRSGKSLPLRLIRFRRRLHLIAEFKDPDDWDGNLGFSKTLR